MFWIMLVGATAFLVSLLATPLVRDTALKLGLTDSPDGSRKFHQKPIPRLGGIAVFVAYVLALGVTFATNSYLGLTLFEDNRSLVLIVAATLIVFATGLADDLKGLTPSQKLIGQFFAACVAYVGGVQINSVQGHSLPVWLSLCLSIGLLIFCSNAFNLIDGLDGLAAGLAFLAAFTVFLVSLMRHNTGLMLMTIPLCGALLGFLRYNFNPASIFLGDSGSLTLGFLLGSFGILWSDKSATLLGMTAPVMALALPLLDACVSFLRRFLRSQPVFSGDRRHIHHRLLDRGMTARRAVLCMYAFGSVSAVLSLLQNVLHDEFRGLVIVLFVGLVGLGIQYLGYAEFGAAAARLFNLGRFRKGVDLEVRVRILDEKLALAQTRRECWELIRDAYPNFGFTGARFFVAQEAFEDFANGRSDVPLWQIRIPLPEGQHVNFYSELGAKLSAMSVIPAFVAVVENRLKDKPFVVAKAPVVMMPRKAASPSTEGIRALAQTAAAGSN